MSKFNVDAYDLGDAASLRRATAKVIEAVAKEQAISASDAENAASAVLSVARSGYARQPHEIIDADDLAEAAIARMRATAS